MGNKVYISKAFVEAMEEQFYVRPIPISAIKDFNEVAMGYREGVRYVISKIREMYEMQQAQESEEIKLL